METPMTPHPVPVDPPGLPRSSAFAQGVATPAARTVYVGGQNGIDASGAPVEGVEAQCERAGQNVLAVLAEAGVTHVDVATLTAYLAPGIDAVATLPQ